MTIILDPVPFTGQSVPGLEAVHIWSDLVAMNDLGNFPRVRLRRIPGFHALPDFEDNRTPRFGQIGENPRFSIPNGKNVTYEGTIEALDNDSLREFEGRLGSAFSRRDGRMSITPFNWSSSQPWYYDARITAFDPPEELPESMRTFTQGFERKFTLGLRMSDPRFYTAVRTAEARTPAVAAVAGIQLPWRLPVVIPDLTGGSSGVLTVVNLGSAPVDPVIDLYGPAKNPWLENETLGVGIYFKEVEIANGSFIRLDFNSRSILLDGADELRGKLNDEESTWWDPGVPGLRPLEPGMGNSDGTNNLRYGGDVIAPPAVAVVNPFSYANWN